MAPATETSDGDVALSATRESENVFLTRRKKGALPRHAVSLHPAPPDLALLHGDPSAQAELVSSALLHLEAVQQLVRHLEEVPGGNRHGLLSELAAAADGLRQLYFLDAIY